MNVKQKKTEMKITEPNKGITLIALVITIIVILILAGVTIATLTGDNGLLQKATNAKETSTNAEIEEEIRLAWNKVYVDGYLNNTTDKAKALATELGIEQEAVIISSDGKTVLINYREKNKVLDLINGIIREPSAVARAKMVEKFDDNTPITDEEGNTFIVPKGFKIASDSAENVTEGIVIEDATYTNTIGSEFVWIPVSKDSSDANKVKGIKNTTILLSRYTFDESGNPTNQGAKTIDSFYTELTSKTRENAVAKTDINSANGFIAKTNAAGGFWIGRYEARIEGYTGNVETSNANNLPSYTGYNGGKLVEKPEAQVFNYITQNKAAELSRKMYEKENDGTTLITKFESDLINSYAWDTATLFLQEFDNRTGSNLIKYSRQNSVNTGLLATGTVSETNKDKICNVYDMASNCYEWTTETSSRHANPCVKRGGKYWNISDDYTSGRTTYDWTSIYPDFSFRPILYIK